MKVDVKIMACKQRRQKFVLPMLQKMKLKENDTVAYDDRVGGGPAIYTARKAWLWKIQDDVTHRIVLQDDIQICDRFIEYATICAERFPNAVFSLYCPGKKMTKENFERPYVRLKGKNRAFGPAVMFPVEHIKPMWEWIDKTLGTQYPDDDCALMHYIQAMKMDSLTVIPSLSQHWGGVNGQSILGHTRLQVQRSKCWYGPDLHWIDLKFGKVSKTKLDTGDAPMAMRKTQKSKEYFRSLGYIGGNEHDISDKSR